MVPFPGLPPTLVAHRGGAHEAVENSLGAFTHSVACGVLWSETDVLLSSDDEPMLLHDDNLERTTMATGYASRWPHARLQAVSLKGALGADRVEQKIPTLRAALRIADAHYVVEFKAGSRPERTIARTWEVVCEAGAMDRVALASLEVDILRKVAELAPTSPRIAFIRDANHLAAMLRTAAPTAVAVGPEWAVQAQRMLPANVSLWVGLVNDEEQRQAAVEAGALAWVTDRPEAFVALRPQARLSEPNQDTSR